MIGIFLTGLAYNAVIIALVLSLELIWRREPLMSPRKRMKALLFAVINTGATTLFYLTLGSAIDQVREPGLLALPGVVGAILGVIIGDFFYYWMHRAEHHFPLLWRFHSIHHSVDKMGAGAGYHHIGQVMFDAILYLLPMSFFIGGKYAGWIASILAIHGYYLHSTAGFNFGPLSRIFVDNRVHRLHHSKVNLHCNFGVTTIIWDRLFGTARIPKRGEWPDVGLIDQREPSTVYEYLIPLTDNGTSVQIIRKPT